MKLYKTLRDGAFLIFVLLMALFIVEKYVFLIPSSSDDKANLSKQMIQEDQFTKEKIKKISEVLWCENRASKFSMELILSVMVNRAKEKTLDGIYKEVSKPYQFSCLNNKDIIKAQTKRKKDIEMYAVAEEIVYSFLHGNFKSITPATFYYAPSKVSKPKYLQNKTLLVAFENHHFY